MTIDRIIGHPSQHKARSQTQRRPGRFSATVFSAADLAAGLAKLPGDRAVASMRVLSLAPYNVNVERRLAACCAPNR